MYVDTHVVGFVGFPVVKCAVGDESQGGASAAGPHVRTPVYNVFESGRSKRRVAGDARDVTAEINRIARVTTYVSVVGGSIGTRIWKATARDNKANTPELR